MKAGAKILSEKEVSQLPQILKRFLPWSAVVHNIVQLHLQNRHNTNQMKTKFYCCSQVLEEESIFLVCILEKTYEETEVSVFTSDTNGGNAESLEGFERLINWEQPNTFASTNGRFTERIKEICSRNGGTFTETECKFNIMNCDRDIEENYLIKEKLLVNTKGIRVAPLSQEDAKLVTTNWKFAREETEREIVDIINNIATCGVYVDSELASWILVNQIGTMSAMHTVELHRGKGYAEIVARNATKAARDMGLVPAVEMEPYNSVSFNLFSKIGYEFVGKSEWVCYSPKQ